MRAGLHRHVERRAARPLARLVERDALAVAARPSRLGRSPGRRPRRPRDDDRADRRLGVGSPPASLGKVERKLEKALSMPLILRSRNAPSLPLSSRSGATSQNGSTSLPLLVAACVEQWSLELEEPVDTAHGLVVPAGEVVLKLNAPSHFEADHEAEALERWSGDGAVRMVARDDAGARSSASAAGRERRSGTLDVDQVPVVAELLPVSRSSWSEPHPFRHLAHEADRWADELPRRFELAGRPFERGLLDLALDVFRSADPRASFLVNQDLHGGNVLRAEREPWLVIDPKPLVGEREIDAVGLLRNAALEDEPVASIRRWLDVLADLGLDRGRARAWGAAHALAWAWRRAWTDGTRSRSG